MRGARMAGSGTGPWRRHRRRPVAAGSRRGGPRLPVGLAREDAAGAWPVARRVWGGPWCAPMVAWRVRPRVQVRGAVAFLARATPVAPQSPPWGHGRRMARGGGRTIHPVAPRAAVACASQAGCGPTSSPPV